MSWKVMWRDKRPAEPKIGDAWFMRLDDEEDNAAYYTKAGIRRLSPSYDPTWRSPIVIELPPGDPFCIDWAVCDHGRPDASDHGWNVCVLGPFIDNILLDITLSPSINVVGIYHGFIKNGIIGDDVEGRLFL